MNSFDLYRPTTLSEARTALLDPSAHIIAGGTDILGEIKEGTSSPGALVDISLIPGLRGIDHAPSETTIGAMTTLAEIERNEHISGLFPVLSQAAASVATPQIRNAGTVGGNLCQRPRCWYYRSPLFDCLKKGGSTCFAVSGMNKYHAVLGGDGCHIVHPSDLAVALVALDSEVEVFDGQESRRMPAADFFVTPAQNMLSETVIERGTIVTRVRLPSPPPNSRSVYLKAKERQAYDFALVSVAATLTSDNGVITGAGLALGGVAPVPYPVPDVVSALLGRSVNDVDPRELGRLAVEDAQPMSDNGYKVRLASNLVARAVATLLEGLR